MSNTISKEDDKWYEELVSHSKLFTSRYGEIEDFVNGTTEVNLDILPYEDILETIQELKYIVGLADKIPSPSDRYLRNFMDYLVAMKLYQLVVHYFDDYMYDFKMSDYGKAMTLNTLAVQELENALFGTFFEDTQTTNRSTHEDLD